jgi:hypothetical protein
MVKYAKGAGVGAVSCFTNGILLTKEKTRTLLEAGIDLVEVSIDAYSREVYGKIRRNPHFDTVVGNTLRMIEMRNDLNAKTRIVVSAVNHAEFQAEKSDFERFWRQHADMAIFRRPSSFGGRIDDSSIPRNSVSNKAATAPCPQLWTRFNVAPSGRIIFCTTDWGDEEIVGDLNEPGVSIESIWNSEPYRVAREKSLVGELTLKCCHNCTDSAEARWKDSYEKMAQRFAVVKVDPAGSL